MSWKNMLLNLDSSIEKNQKHSDDFLYRKLTLKSNVNVKVGTFWHLAITLISNLLSLPWKLKNRYCHDINASPRIFSTHYATDCCNNTALQRWKGRSDFVSSLWYVVARAKIRSCCQQLDSTLQTYSYAPMVTNRHAVKSSQV